MTLTNKPKKSKYQVGEIVYYLNNGKGVSSEVVKVTSLVTNPNDDSYGTQENVYLLANQNRSFREEELFHSMNALMFNIKGDYLNNIYPLVAESGNNDMNGVDFSYSSFEYAILAGCNFINSNFEGAKLIGVNFLGTNLTGSFLKNAMLTNAYLPDTILTNVDCRGTNLFNCTLPSNANTKATFKSVVGAGNWDSDTTIWIDGLPIGN